MTYVEPARLLAGCWKRGVLLVIVRALKELALEPMLYKVAQVQQLALSLSVWCQASSLLEVVHTGCIYHIQSSLSTIYNRYRPRSGISLFSEPFDMVSFSYFVCPLMISLSNWWPFFFVSFRGLHFSCFEWRIFPTIYDILQYPALIFCC